MKEAVVSAVELIDSTDLDKWDEIIKLAKDDPDLPEIWRGANVGTRSRVSIGPRRAHDKVMALKDHAQQPCQS
jgi:hypothetical protein